MKMCKCANCEKDMPSHKYFEDYTTGKELVFCSFICAAVYCEQKRCKLKNETRFFK